MEGHHINQPLLRGVAWRGVPWPSFAVHTRFHSNREKCSIIRNVYQSRHNKKKSFSK